MSANTQRGETIRARRQRLALLPRACEGCKIRKTRCDRSNPCSNCTAAGIACEQSAVESEQRPKTDRVALLEGRIKLLEERLQKVEQQRPSQEEESEAAVSLTVSNVDLSSGHLVPNLADSPSSIYEGDSSFNKHVAQASEAAQQAAIAHTPGAASSIDSSLNDVHTLLQPSSSLLGSENFRFSPGNGKHRLPSLEPLPSALVLSVLRRIKESSPIFLSGYTVSDSSLVHNICQAIYFPTEPVSLGQLASMNGLLFYIFKEYLVTQDPICKQHDLKKYLAACERNFTLSIETYEILAVPSFENVLALVLAVIKCQSECKPELCFTFITAAANHCQMLGYHREVTYRHDGLRVAEQKRRIFWSLYIFDKNMSLLLGRASSIRDSEIDVQYPSQSKDPTQAPWDRWFVIAIRLGKEQGQIYETQYSASALKTPPEAREKHMHERHTALQTWRSDLEKIDATRVKHPQIFALSRNHWDVMYYSTLTTLLRASMSSMLGAGISFPCFEAARSSLQSHLRCFSGYQKQTMLSDADFANWVLHNSSFSPFLVIFLHAVAANSEEDVELLDHVVDTLRIVRKASRSSERLLLICAMFAQIARRMVEERRLGVGTYDQASDSLHLTAPMAQIPLAWSDNDFPEIDMGVETMGDWDLSDVADIFNSWAEGQSVPYAVFSDST